MLSIGEYVDLPQFPSVCSGVVSVVLVTDSLHMVMWVLMISILVFVTPERLATVVASEGPKKQGRFKPGSQEPKGLMSPPRTQMVTLLLNFKFLAGLQRRNLRKNPCHTVELEPRATIQCLITTR